MAVFQIGRLFSDYDVDITGSSWAGSRWSVTGDVVLSSANRADEGVAIREQIIGMNGNPDEPFVAVQWSEEPTVNGFYRLLGINCQAGQLLLVDGLLRWSAELERVSGSEFAALESHVTWQLATNTHAITNATFGSSTILKWGVPASAFEFGPVSGLGALFASAPTSTALTLDSGFGSIKLVAQVQVPNTGILGWSVDPTDYYDGNCRVTTDFGAATDQKVFGRRADDTYNWQVSNGLVRFSVNSSDDSLDVETWRFTSPAWLRPNQTRYRFMYNGAAVSYSTMTILRNSPECVAVRLGCNTGGTSNVTRVYVDLTILRGSQMVYGYLTTPVPSGFSMPTLGINTTPSVGSTSLTGGITASSADANGMKYIIVTGTPAVTNSLASGRVETTANSDSLSFGLTASGIGVVPNLGALVPNLEFFARRAEVTRVVAR